MRDKVIIYGTGGSGKALYEQLVNENSVDVIAFADSFKTGELYGIKIIQTKDLLEESFDLIYIASIAVEQIYQTLLNLGIKRNMIDKSFMKSKEEARRSFLKSFAEEIYRKNIEGSVAEAGVFQGEFAAAINQSFMDRKLYLFDTFSGFDDRDIQLENDYGDIGKGDYFKKTSPELVMSKMKYKDKVIIKRGYVPETLQDIEDEFCFVNLDMDLYKPTLEALRFFYPRVKSGGGILIHDYFATNTFMNVKKAVIEFIEETSTKAFPIGDELSIFIVK